MITWNTSKSCVEVCNITCTITCFVFVPSFIFPPIVTFHLSSRLCKCSRLIQNIYTAFYDFMSHALSLLKHSYQYAPLCLTFLLDVSLFWFLFILVFQIVGTFLRWPLRNVLFYYSEVIMYNTISRAYLKMHKRQLDFCSNTSSSICQTPPAASSHSILRASSISSYLSIFDTLFLLRQL